MNDQSLIACVFGNLSCVAEIIPADAQVEGIAERLLRAGELVAYHTDTVDGLGMAAGDDAAAQTLSGEGAAALQAVASPHCGRHDSGLGSRRDDSRTHAGRQVLAGAADDHHARGAGVQECRAGQARRRGPTGACPRPGGDTIRDLGEPLTGTNANRSGARLPVSAAEVALQLGEMVALVIDGGRSAGGIESTVIDVSEEGGPRLLREGPVSRKELERVLGRPVG